jgi:DNA polymerase-3 subunit epsilon
MIAGVRRLLARRTLARGTAVDPRLSRYAELQFRPPRRHSLRRTRFVVLDTETTGLDVESSALLSLAAVEVLDGRVRLDRRLELIFAHDHVGGKSAAPIHGLLRRDLQGGRPASEGVLDFLEFAESAVLVGHHVAFDVAMLDNALRRIGPVRLYNRVIDTNQLARRLDSAVLPRDDVPTELRSLDALCELHGIPIPLRHTAAGDALATATLFLALLARARQRGITTLGALLAR